MLETVDPASIRANGYSYLIEMLYCCERSGFTVGEVPIIFADRQLGQSKISRNEIVKAGRTVLRLAVRRLSRRGRRMMSISRLRSTRPLNYGKTDDRSRPQQIRAKEAQQCRRATRDRAPA